MDFGTNTMKLHEGEIAPAVFGDEPEPIAPPRLIGDAILLTYEGRGTMVYWDGNRWYPVEP